VSNIQLKKILAKSKKYIFGELLGNHNSKQIGDGYDFAKIRPYEYGENIRRIDPFASAKTGEIHLRSFYESKELNVHVISLMSGSLFFGTKVLKQELVAQIVSLIGFSTVKNSDTFTLSLFSSKLLEKTIPTKKEAGIRRAVEKVLNYKVLGESIDYDALHEYVLKKIKKRSLIFLLGDFYDIPKLRALNKKHEVVVVRVRDSFEINPQEIGNLGIVDPSTKQKVDLTFSNQSIKKYKQELKKVDLKFGEYLKSSGIRQIEIVSSDNLYLKFLSFFRGL
jgi:uncharacterized protein (DUF58 family)